ncbi:phosphoadenylyl-sulfate reductase [Motilimonas pumila]|uniref:Adenosine 5'-phosphosulfate reductase n=1 Tax=Motilimonas pumila TaxID=2303987 RepID=A0A418YDT5_9GAMM|nr:phosphoadenylyl-sulfate reductase [Motilimonas pumila]RJG42700.1 phosphoadenylyl-sulfate reductase [Motilimonas pumila]
MTNEISAASNRIVSKIDELIDLDKKIFITSSFQTQSLPLLHIISQAKKTVPVAFIDTGYLFPETYKFKDYLVERLGIEVVSLTSNVSMLEQKSSNGDLLFLTNTERCCQLNKVDVLQEYSKNFDIWVSGVRADQSKTRSHLKEFQTNTNGTTRYHPMLPWTSKMVFDYRKLHNLPEHPLEAKGYLSVGCMPCTSTYLESVGSERSGRWQGMKKEECGLHTNLA